MTAAGKQEQIGVYISHNEADLEWVEDWLVPELKRADINCRTSDDPFILGATKLDNASAAVRYSHKTIAIISTAWLNDQWRKLDSSLARSADPSAERRSLFLIILDLVELPEYLDQITAIRIDRHKHAHIKKKIRRLVHEIEQEIPYALPVGHSFWTKNHLWRTWLRRNRWRIYRAVLFIGLFALLVSILLQKFPFQPREGWQRVMEEDFTDKLAFGKQLGNSIIFASYNDRECHTPGGSGTWLYDTTTEQLSAPLDIPPIQVEKTPTDCVLAHATGLIEIPNKQLTFLATKHGGLLKKANGEQTTNTTWVKVAPDVLPPTIKQIALLQNGTLVVNGLDDGLYYSDDQGDNWKNIDSGTANEKAYPALRFEAMSASGNTLYAATRKPSFKRPHNGAGIYQIQFYNTAEKAPLVERVIPARGRFNFYKIRSDANNKQLLVAAFDIPNSGKVDHQLQLYKTSRFNSPPVVLYSSEYRFADIHFNQQHWYTIHSLGGIFKRGQLDRLGHKKTLYLTRCIPYCSAPSFIDTRFTPHPWLAANNNVYQLHTVPWYRYLWP